MNYLTIFEFDKIIEGKQGAVGPTVPSSVFNWLDMLTLRSETGTTRWLKPAQLNGQRAIQFTGYVGVIRAPCGFQIEVLPKTERSSSPEKARALLVEMLKCLPGFRHINTGNADLVSERMPILEIFIQQFLLAVGLLVKRGVRSDYVPRQEHLSFLRGRLLVAKQISQNVIKRDRFFTEHDEFSQDRAENRLIRSALRYALALSRSQGNQRLARELSFVFSDVPASQDIAFDINRIRLDRGMGYYVSALSWAQLILRGFSPTSSLGTYHAQSLLFPMEAVFEAYVEKHLVRQLRANFFLKAQASSQHLIKHENQRWFRMMPDLLVIDRKKTRLLLDTKWKLLDSAKKDGREKYRLSEADFYQLYAYGNHYLDGNGDIVLIYPKTDDFSDPLPVFDFLKGARMRLWVLPFCLKKRILRLPKSPELQSIFVEDH